MNSRQQGGIVGRLRRLAFGGRDKRAQEAAAIYAEAVARARRPELYVKFGVPDTPAGRFEMVAWHVLVQLAALADRANEGRRLGQEVVDLMFSDMDRSLRELGVGDLSVGREMRKLGETWQARIALAERALPAGPTGKGREAADLAELATFLEKNAAGAEGASVDGIGLASDLLDTLERLRADGAASGPSPAP
jgi:cytochrome b pre-mRNA-processing protein 3